jgi:hypothetical protein
MASSKLLFDVALISDTFATDIPLSFRVNRPSLTATQRSADHCSDSLEKALPARFHSIFPHSRGPLLRAADAGCEAGRYHNVVAGATSGAGSVSVPFRTGRATRSGM